MPLEADCPDESKCLDLKPVSQRLYLVDNAKPPKKN